MGAFLLFIEFASVILIFGLTFNETAQLGADCKVARTGASGTCKQIQDCPKVVNDIVQLQVYPTLCGFINHNIQIVCCQNEPTRATTTQAPEITRISQKSTINSY